MQHLTKHIADAESRSMALRDLHDRVASNLFIRGRWFDAWIVEATRESSIGLIEWLRRLLFDRAAWRSYRVVRTILADKDNARSTLNDHIVRSVIHANKEYFDKVETYPLTARQRESCASDEDATLVIAGAGTGKTSTILSKIGLLLKTNQCNPREILAISFTNKSAAELEERVKEKLGVEVQISTFHKFGLNILSRAENGKPLLAPFAAEPAEKTKHIEEILGHLNDDEKFRSDFVQFCAYYRIESKSLWHFSSLAEYSDWIRSNKIVSLDGIPKKSLQECVIANWMILNSVRFEYERPYEKDTKTVDRRQYCPDFWLPDAKLYIEHFGLDENGNTAPFINAAEYKRGIDWKRDIHRRYKTQLVETYSWELDKGLLIAKLSDAIRKAGCQTRPISSQTALELLNKSGVVSKFSELVGSFLTLYKGNGNKILNRAKVDAMFGGQREKYFLKLFEAIRAEYESRNHARGQIDFEDMIGRAAVAVQSGNYRNPYRYILIDEFQDISPGRAALVNAVRDSRQDCALFAVGDDWQSIYRFTGSDIGSMTRFADVFGHARQINLDTTFRFDDKAAELSSAFVLKNKAQIEKNIASTRSSSSPSLILYLRPPNDPPLEWALNEISKQAKPNATVLILERYKFHLPDEQEWRRLSRLYPTLQLDRMSIHAAKGLEADFVVMGLRGGSWGFPSQVVDDPLFEMVLTQADAFPYGEERRLFYVAITRARIRTIVVAETGADKSIFTEELISERYPIQVIGEDVEKLRCKVCGSGTMQLRDGSNGRFYGCSNYPLCRNTEQTCPQCHHGLLVSVKGGGAECHLCGHRAKMCPKCKTGVLIPKTGKYGAFVGCSNYRDPDIHCDFTSK